MAKFTEMFRSIWQAKQATEWDEYKALAKRAIGGEDLTEPEVVRLMELHRTHGDGHDLEALADKAERAQELAKVRATADKRLKEYADATKKYQTHIAETSRLEAEHKAAMAQREQAVSALVGSTRTTLDAYEAAEAARQHEAQITIDIAGVFNDPIDMAAMKEKLQAERDAIIAKHPTANVGSSFIELRPAAGPGDKVTFERVDGVGFRSGEKTAVEVVTNKDGDVIQRRALSVDEAKLLDLEFGTYQTPAWKPDDGKPLYA